MAPDATEYGDWWDLAVDVVKDALYEFGHSFTLDLFEAFLGVRTADFFGKGKGGKKRWSLAIHERRAELDQVLKGIIDWQLRGKKPDKKLKKQRTWGVEVWVCRRQQKPS